MRLVLLIAIAWLSGWGVYAATFPLVYQQSPFTNDVAIMGYFALLFGVPFCLLVIVPVYWRLRAALGPRANRTLLVLTGVALSALYMSLLVGPPFRSSESTTFHIFAAASSAVFGAGFPWAMTPARRAPGE